MKRDLFRRYVWLVDVIRHAEKITYEEISNLWKTSPLNTDQSPLALRTFHNHREAIEHLFGIRILCNRSDHNRYYVADDNNMDTTRLKVWMLQTLSLSNIINRANDVEKRIVLDITPEEKFGLTNVIEAMKHNKVVSLVYSVPTDGLRTMFDIAPYCLRYWKNTWYVLGRDMKTNRMLAFDLARVLNLTATDTVFEYPENFSPAEYFKKYYGMDMTESHEPDQIRIRLSGKNRDMVRTLPLHPSQKEIMADLDSSIFEYHIIPSNDFISAILAMGSEAEVVSPLSLRQRVSDIVRDMVRLYAEASAIAE